ncbi:glycoside hydrolase family 108 protein [Falsiroseomonas sp.]|uniref:glycoside hydrolase family 108 protein n=1 Tax=Falsiroseomonas sp. TaxID=2870721 RepID=UPI0027269710|nr:glycosyl hydrolase 108 family protein [Falsiroseomonas sp.]MDO9499020.1 glycosyl hydrolase 108 family protein [Falsiroseomonas sp.]
MDNSAPHRTFAQAMDFVLRFEGGFVDDPADPGGATNLGISLRYARSKGRLLDLDRDGDVDAADIRLITKEIASDLYRRDFWDAVQGDDLPAAIAVVAFDAAINCGPARSIRRMQGAVGASQDGVLGPRTRLAISRATPGPVVAEMLAQRFVHHANLPTWRNFGVGWARRCAALGLFAATFLETGR